MRRPGLLKVMLLGAAGTLLARRNKARKAEQELWHEATSPAAPATQTKGS